MYILEISAEQSDICLNTGDKTTVWSAMSEEIEHIENDHCIPPEPETGEPSGSQNRLPAVSRSLPEPELAPVAFDADIPQEPKCGSIRDNQSPNVDFSPSVPDVPVSMSAIADAPDEPEGSHGEPRTGSSWLHGSWLVNPGTLDKHNEPHSSKQHEPFNKESNPVSPPVPESRPTLKRKAQEEVDTVDQLNIKKKAVSAEQDEGKDKNPSSASSSEFVEEVAFAGGKGVVKAKEVENAKSDELDEVNDEGSGEGCDPECRKKCCYPTFSPDISPETSSESGEDDERDEQPMETDQNKEDNPASSASSKKTTYGKPPLSPRTKKIKKEAKAVMRKLHHMFGRDKHGIPLPKIARRDVGDVDSTEKYVDRMVSYTVGKWRGKPHELSPRVCASHGWRCSETDMLVCNDCNAFLHTPLPLMSSGSLMAYNRFVKKYVDLVRSGHRSGCIWKTSTYREPLEDVVPEKILNAILKRYDALEPIVSKDFIIKPVSEITPEHLSKFNGKNPDVAQLAICHWEYAGEDDQIKCNKCQRKTALFLFKEKKPFDPLKQHYQWCPIFDSGKHHCSWREEIDAAVGAQQEARSHLGQVMHIKMRIKEAFGDHKAPAPSNN
uniref:C3HC-type domain-containing protein n=1 Tax=Steinernema glaseri TaxID=37863 RepID=A0A1I8AWM3_9BILA